MVVLFCSVLRGVCYKIKLLEKQRADWPLSAEYLKYLFCIAFQNICNVADCLEILLPQFLFDL